jgi:hypothetical protein
MLVITTPLAPLGLIAIIYLGGLFEALSSKLNAVTKKGDYLKWFKIANALITIATLSQAIRGTAILAPEQAPAVLRQAWFSLVSFHLPLAVGVTLDLLLVWYYWNWILKEQVE